MTRRLILMRHAKSEWAHERIDHKRPLNERGIRSAKNLGVWLQVNDYIPDQAIVSDSMRTMQTFVGLNLKMKAEWTRELYHASADTIFRTLQRALGETVMIVSHNPGAAEFADKILHTPEDSDEFLRFPTGATLVAEFDILDWNHLQWGSATKADFIVPRALD